MVRKYFVFHNIGNNSYLYVHFLNKEAKMRMVTDGYNDLAQ